MQAQPTFKINFIDCETLKLKYTQQTSSVCRNCKLQIIESVSKDRIWLFVFQDAHLNEIQDCIFYEENCRIIILIQHSTINIYFDRNINISDLQKSLFRTPNIQILRKSKYPSANPKKDASKDVHCLRKLIYLSSNPYIGTLF